jgi:hypothetical protein
VIAFLCLAISPHEQALHAQDEANDAHRPRRVRRVYRPAEHHNRQATWSETTPDGRWQPYTYEEILARDKVSLDLFWLRDESLEDSASLPEPHVLAQEIADDLRSALTQIEDVLGDLEQRVDAGAMMRSRRPAQCPRISSPAVAGTK